QDRFAHPLIPPQIMGPLIDRVLGSPQHASVTPQPGVTPEQRCLKEASPILGYKARPLNGIWATAPYLHNGSVRTLYQLLLPADQREAAFEVGNREFDPTQVGYVSSEAANHTTLKVGAGAGIGDSNAGHD